MTHQPLVSIVLSVRNGLPHVRDAIESVRASSYTNYELVVQDGASTDGTLQYLQQVQGLSQMSIVSEADGGRNQGFNRALQRCRGDVVCSVDADNRLRPGAIEMAIARLSEHPDAAVVYGCCNMIAEDGSLIHRWTAPAFDLLGLIDGTVVPPYATSFFVRRHCDGQLWVDEAFETVGDFDMWLRLSDRLIIRVFDTFADVRIGQQSSTWDASLYEKHCRFKLLALRRFLDGAGRDAVMAEMRERAEGGIYLWALDSLATIGGDQRQIDHYFLKASASDIRSERFRRIAAAVHPSPGTMSPVLVSELLECGVECVLQGRAKDALAYFGLVQSDRPATTLPNAPMSRPTLSRGELAALCERLLGYAPTDERRRQGVLAELRSALLADVQENIAVRQHLQSEVDKRDALLADVMAAMHAEVNQDEVIRAQLQTEVDRRDQRNADLVVTMRDEVEKRDRALGDAIVRMRTELHAEIGRRDEYLAEVQAERNNAVHVRDGIIDELRADLRNPLRYLWKRLRRQTA